MGLGQGEERVGHLAPLLINTQGIALCDPSGATTLSSLRSGEPDRCEWQALPRHTPAARSQVQAPGPQLAALVARPLRRLRPEDGIADLGSDELKHDWLSQAEGMDEHHGTAGR
jgi:hypothetical protein